LLQELEEPLDSSLSSLLEDLVLRLSDSLFLVLSHLLINELFSHFVAPKCHEVNIRACKVWLEMSFNEGTLAHSRDTNWYQYDYGVLS
jgi:hypothetical protein